MALLIQFIGNPNADAQDGKGRTAIYGIDFAINQPVDVSHLPVAQQNKLKNNNHFRVVEAKAAPAKAAPVPTAAEVVASHEEVEVEAEAEVAVKPVAEVKAPAPVARPAAPVRTGPKIVKANKQQA
jgi:hypothetical protein